MKFLFSGIPLGDIVVSDVELQRDGNTIILAPKEVDLNLIGEIGKVKVSLEQSTIKDNKLLLSLSSPYSLDLDIHVIWGHKYLNRHFQYFRRQ